jgi:hypothetical protein
MDGVIARRHVDDIAVGMQPGEERAVGMIDRDIDLGAAAGQVLVDQRQQPVDTLAVDRGNGGGIRSA